MKILILAGGQGKRLWPISTQECPKQFVHFGDHECLLKKTVRRFLKHRLIKDVYIVTSGQYAGRTFDEIKGFDETFQDRIFTEPYSKNTAPAISWGIRMLLQTQRVGRDELIVTIPIDHVFSDEEAFLNQMLDEIIKIHPGEILAFGVACTKPSTGYGYIKQGEPCSKSTYRVARFLEKPLEHVANELVAEGGWLWNIGIYVFSISTYLEALKLKHQILYKIAVGDAYIERDYKSMTPISIDDAVIVQAHNVQVRVLVNLHWSDIGSLESLYEFLTQRSCAQKPISNTGCQSIQAGVFLDSAHSSKHKECIDFENVETEEAIFSSHEI